MDTGGTGPEVSAKGARGVQIGSGNVQFNVFAPVFPAALSAYRRQVELIAPETLLDRDAELAQLADFCTCLDDRDYLWLRGRAWTGKTALMSWLVLNPPPGTCVVSFFITARLAAQNDREAFLDVVIEQLATLLGEPAPYVTPAARPAHLWALLYAAATACERQGRRLVLVVDGLDEDSGAGTQSIAALLPARPPAGMRVVVAGRRDHPVPEDVPDGHPLRNPSVQRLLEASSHAGAVRDDAERELERLLGGTAADQDLPALVAVAGGGLSGQDLAELTGRRAAEVEEFLRVAAGNTIARRPAYGWAGAAADVYVLGHEELQVDVLRRLSAPRVAEYRERLHAWADRYREEKWPAGTPEYLLRGYFRLLGADRDRDRMTGLALDRARHARLLEASGADTAALAEIGAAQDALHSGDRPDLRTLTLLAVRRDHLSGRNRDIPTSLPAVWALLGQPLRAEALARSIPRPWLRVSALTSLSGVLAERSRGHGTQDLAGGSVLGAREVAEEAEAVARAITDPGWQCQALAEAAGALTGAGEADRAAQLAEEAVVVARTITSPYVQAASLTEVAGTLAGTVGAHRAQDIVRDAVAVARIEEFPDLREAALAKADLALAVLRGEDPGPAETRADRATIEIQAINDLERRDMEAAMLATAAVRVGELDRALALAETVVEPWERAGALVTVVGAMARAGNVDRALATARTITVPSEQAQALADVAEAVARAGDAGRAQDLAFEAEALARSGTDTSERQAALAKALARVGDVRRAAAVARTVTDPPTRDRTMAEVARALARAGNIRRAVAVARTITDGWVTPEIWAAMAVALARAGDPDGAETVARAIDHRWTQHRLSALAGVVAEAARTGRTEQAAALAQEGLDLARTVGHNGLRAQALLKAAEMAAATGDADLAEELIEEAETMVWEVANPYSRALEFASLAKALVEAGDVERGAYLARDAVAEARNLTDPGEHARALADAAGALAVAGAVEPARELAQEAVAVTRTFTDPRERESALAERAELMARVGDADRALAVARTVTAPERQAQALAGVARHVGTARACPLIAEALRLGEWHMAVDALADVAPDVLALVADELILERP